MSSVTVFVGGLLALLAAGHLVVGAASVVGTRLGLSPLIVGLTIVAAGTSAPELAVFAQAIRVYDTELATGSIIGSNIANVLLVLGLAATLGRIHVASQLVRRDIPVMIAASFAFLLLSLDGSLGRVDGLLLIAALIVFVSWTIRVGAGEDLATSEPAGLGVVVARPGQARIGVTVTRLVIGIAGLVVAARFVVAGAEEIAVEAGVPELIVGLTVVALGTSAPEISTTLIAALKGHRDLAVGNAVGSNIFNILLVVGASAVASGGVSIDSHLLRQDLPIMAAAAFACLPIVYWDHELDRGDGATLVAFYGAYLAFLSLDATGHQLAQPFAIAMVCFVVPLTAGAIAIATRRQLRRGRMLTVATERGLP